MKGLSLHALLRRRYFPCAAEISPCLVEKLPCSAT
jgi:hypothetical protein